MAKLPSFQFYPGDWMKDPALRLCSAAARGVWMDLICMGFEMGRRGVFRANSVRLSALDLTRMCGEARTVRVHELISRGVLKVAARTGTFYCKRLLLDDLRRSREARKKRGQRVCGVKCPGDVPAMSQPSSTSSSPSGLKTSLSTKKSAPPAKPRARNEIWDALAARFFPTGASKADEGKLKVATAALRAKGATPAEINIRADHYLAEWTRPRGIALTITGLVNNWDQHGPKPQSDAARRIAAIAAEEKR